MPSYCLKSSDKCFGVLYDQFQNNSALNAFCSLFYCISRQNVRCLCVRICKYFIHCSLSLFTFMRWRRKWQPTPVFFPGESMGQRSLVGCCLWGRAESDTTEATQQQQQQQQHPLFYTEKRYCRLNNTEKRDLYCDSLNHTKYFMNIYIL